MKRFLKHNIEEALGKTLGVRIDFDKKCDHPKKVKMAKTTPHPRDPEEEVYSVVYKEEDDIYIACFLHLRPHRIYMTRWTAEASQKTIVHDLCPDKYWGKYESQPEFRTEHPFDGWGLTMVLAYGHPYLRLSFYLPEPQHEQVSRKVERILSSWVAEREEGERKLKEEQERLQQERLHQQKLEAEHREQERQQRVEINTAEHLRKHRQAPDCARCNAKGGTAGDVWMCWRPSCNRLLCRACYARDNSFCPEDLLCQNCMGRLWNGSTFYAVAHCRGECERGEIDPRIMRNA